MDEIFRLNNTLKRDPRIESWFCDFADPHRLSVRPWFERMRGMGPDVREIFHDGCPVACVGDVPFGYVNAFRSHVSVGFFHGAALKDPAGLLEGAGKRMRHVKLKPMQSFNSAALGALIDAAYAQVRAMERSA